MEEKNKIQEAVPTTPLNGPFPKELDKWNWGAFLITWIWAIGNNTLLGLLSLIPTIGFIISIIFGLKGNEWAWQNKKFENIEQFKSIQKKWMIWGLVIAILPIAIILLLYSSLTA